MGLNHGRRDPDEVRVGDVIDSWRVIGVEPLAPAHAFLRHEGPGRGRPGVRDRGNRARASGASPSPPTGTRPASGGSLYWYAMFPAHLVLFDALVKEIARRASVLDEATGKS